MKAIVYTGANKAEFKDVPMPEVKEGWALMKVSHAGICGTDVNIFQGFHPRAKAPLVMGHEFSGTLVSEDVPGLPKGSRVTSYPLLSCGCCEPCRSGNAHVCNDLKLLGIDCDGGFGEYVAVPQESLIPLSEGTSLKLGALVEPVAVCVHALRERGFLAGDNALVIGCGAIGLCTALTVRQFGASQILMFENDEARAELARGMGFEVVNTTGMNVAEYCKSRTDGNGFDWVMDCAGVQPVADMLLDAVKVKGHILMIASYPKPASMPFIQGMFKEITIEFTRVYRRKDFAVAAQLVEKDPDFERVITHVLPPEKAQEGMETATSKGDNSVKIMFCFD